MDKENKKVVIPSEVAEAIETYLTKNTKERMVVVKIGEESHFNGKCEILNAVPIETICLALFCGFTVEQTPEEKVREYYDGLVEVCSDTYSDTDTLELASYEAAGVFKTLDLLGIKIEGVNA